MPCVYGVSCAFLGAMCVYRVSYASMRVSYVSGESHMSKRVSHTCLWVSHISMGCHMCLWGATYVYGGVTCTYGSAMHLWSISYVYGVPHLRDVMCVYGVSTLEVGVPLSGAGWAPPHCLFFLSVPACGSGQGQGLQPGMWRLPAEAAVRLRWEDLSVPMRVPEGQVQGPAAGGGTPRQLQR